MSTTSIKLDAHAIAYLFPEGSEARIELQQTVMNEMVRKLVDREVTSMKAAIDAAVKTEFSARLGVEGIKVLGQNLTLSDPARRLIADKATAVYVEAVNKAVAAVAEPELESIRRKLHVALDTGLREQIKEQAKIALRGIVA
jgi:hypothetical protein